MPFSKGDPNINRNGRPKRKTITELIHAKLDDTPEGWEKLISLFLTEMFSNKNKDLLKELWHYTDGMPKQKMNIDVEGKIDTILYLPNERTKPITTDNTTTETTESS